MLKAIDYVKILWDYLLYEDPLEKADVIIGFGSNDLTIAERGTQLFLADYAPYLLFSGGLGKGTEGIWKQTEAETFFEIAQNLGADPSRILIENNSTNTGENIRFSKDLLKRSGIDVRKAIIVHQPNMGRRIYAALKKQWPDITPLIAPANCTLEQYLKELQQNGVDQDDIFSNIVGDFQRMDVFAKEGYQIEQEIPQETQKAYEALCKLGYTKYII